MPSPFLEVHEGSGQRTSNTVPGVLLGLELLVSGVPSLFKSRKLLWGPCLDKVMDGFDVVNEDLITWLDVALAVDVVGYVNHPSCVMAEMLGHSLA